MHDATSAGSRSSGQTRSAGEGIVVVSVTEGMGHNSRTSSPWHVLDIHRPAVQNVRQIMRRRFLCVALPAALLASRAQAHPRRLELACYSSQALAGTAAQLFAAKAAALSPDILQVALSERPPTVPFDAIGKTSALASYYAPAFATVEPVLGLCTVPMLAASFEEAEALHRIARPYYEAALARHGQVLLAIEPWRPAALWSTFRIRSAADLRGAAFALDETPYVGAGWAELFGRVGTRRAAYAEAEVLLSGGYTREPGVRPAIRLHHGSLLGHAAHVPDRKPGGRSTRSAKRNASNSLPSAGRPKPSCGARSARSCAAIARTSPGGACWCPTSRRPTSCGRCATAAEPDVRRFVASLGADGATLLGDYRRVIGF